MGVQPAAFSKKDGGGGEMRLEASRCKDIAVGESCQSTDGGGLPLLPTSAVEMSCAASADARQVCTVMGGRTLDGRLTTAEVVGDLGKEKIKNNEEMEDDMTQEVIKKATEGLDDFFASLA